MRLLLILCAMLAAFCCHAQINPSDFVTTWKTDNPGGTAANQILFPASGEYVLYYESIPTGTSGTLPATGTFTDAQTITLPAAGTYRIVIKPAGATPFHRFGIGAADQQKLLSIQQWGATGWSSFESAFLGCTNLSEISATDVPDLSVVTSMQSMFWGCSSLVSAPAIGNWDVSNVNDMEQTFMKASAFNPAIGDWDVSSVTNMGSMFQEATVFNQPIGNWDVSAVTRMDAMFAIAPAFNQPIGNWDVSSVTKMQSMFQAATAFNQPIGNWDVSAVTDMTAMFLQAATFNQPIGNWDVSTVSGMPGMFRGATAFNQPINGWKVSKVVNLSHMFYLATSFNQSLAGWRFGPFLVGLIDFVTGSGQDCSHYSAMLIGWASDTARTEGGVLINSGRAQGPDAVDARNALVAKGWFISGDVLDPNCAALPVTLVYFSAKPLSGNSVEIKWETAQETANERFVIERSRDLTSFETVAEIRDVAGNSNALQTYRAIDPTPFAGTSYYRLVQYDLDGTRTSSRVVSVIVRSQDYAVYPNPTGNQPFRISLDEPGTADVQVHDTSGKSIAFTRKPDGGQSIVIVPARPLACGTYLITVRERALTRTHSLIVN